MYPYDFFTQYQVDNLIDRVFVGMWFDQEHRSRYDNIIARAIERSNLTPYRVDQPVSGDSIPINILEGILNSRIVLFDISYITSEITLSPSVKKRFRNANVMYELGLAHAWRLPEEVIVIRDDDDLLPFDVTTFRVHKYDFNNIENSIMQLSKVITDSLVEIKRAKSLMVERAAKSLDSRCLSFIGSNRGRYFSETEYDPLLTHIINRLLDLRILWLDTSGGGGSYAYHWTELGRDVIKYHQIEPCPKEGS